MKEYQWRRTTFRLITWDPADQVHITTGLCSCSTCWELRTSTNERPSKAYTLERSQTEPSMIIQSHGRFTTLPHSPYDGFSEPVSFWTEVSSTSAVTPSTKAASHSRPVRRHGSPSRKALQPKIQRCRLHRTKDNNAHGRRPGLGYQATLSFKSPLLQYIQPMSS